MAKVEALIAIVRDKTDVRLPAAARFALMAIADEIEAAADQIDRPERATIVEAKRDEDMRRLTTIPGVGPITAATIKALVPDPGGFTSARHFAAWLGLTPRSYSSGGKERLGRISKMGNPELRSLLVVGATAVLRVARNDALSRPWLKALLARPPAFPPKIGLLVRERGGMIIAASGQVKLILKRAFQTTAAAYRAVTRSIKT
ncbi:transposase [Bradyrhizobium sp. SBR1B]|nr:transposase [Bradyrhizobium sp. SBR1B]